MKNLKKYIWIHVFTVAAIIFSSCTDKTPRLIKDFTTDWKFFSGNDSLAFKPTYNDSAWRTLNLPHDWSIEGKFSKDHPATFAGGALPTGIGWYRKNFIIEKSDENKTIYIDFDGIYQNSEVWINGHYLGKRPNGYISFRYELTPYLNFGKKQNVIAVKVDNSAQPNSRWYTGSGIYRNVWLVSTGKVHVNHWGAFITTPVITNDSAKVNLEISLKNKAGSIAEIRIKSVIVNQYGEKITESEKIIRSVDDSLISVIQKCTVTNPSLWSTDNPYLYKAITYVCADDRLSDIYETPFGIRYFNFDSLNGFALNGKPMKIYGVNNHHDLGALGAAVNTRAIERQLEILKDMGCNAIRTAHNPPAPELLDLCDKMGFLVMDEAFDVWKKKKVKKDYHLYWDARLPDGQEWHEKDLKDMVLRDRNHPSVIMWSIGNEIREQFDSTGVTITKELVKMVKTLDTTRPVTCALTENIPEKNFIYQSSVLDVLSFNYKQEAYPDFPKNFPGQKMIVAECMSALATRGHYDMPSDTVKRWPPAYNQPFDSNAGYTVSAYDHVSAYWGSTHEETWKIVKKHDFISGLFLWSGFDYLGEPTPYPWPARSSYFGVIDLAGFPKDAYYLYQSEWTDESVLHIFPHWNWTPGEIIDIWAYYNNANEVELFLNGKSLGIKSKKNDEFHVMWRVNYEPGAIKAISRKNGKTVLEKEIRTAGEPAKIEMIADRNEIKADGKDLSFVTVKILDQEGNLMPDADNLINFKINGNGLIAGVDNGYQASLEPFKANYRKAWKGLCLVIIQSIEKSGKITLHAEADGFLPSRVEIKSR